MWKSKWKTIKQKTKTKQKYCEVNCDVVKLSSIDEMVKIMCNRWINTLINEDFFWCNILFRLNEIFDAYKIFDLKFNFELFKARKFQ